MIDSKELEVHLESLTLIERAKFLFSLAYEIKEIKSETVLDTDDYVLKTLSMIDALPSSNNAERKIINHLSRAFCHQYFVFSNGEKWIEFSKENKIYGDRLLELINNSMKSLKVAISELSAASSIQAPNAIYKYIIDLEIQETMRWLRSHLRNGREPDVDSVYMFIDSLKDDSLWEVLARQVHKDVSRELVLNVKK